MASMNWLGFSLSPQEIPSQSPNQDHHNPFTSTTGECFDLDWNLKGNSEISMLMGNQEVEEEPKLENFLGSSHSFRDHQQQINGDHYRHRWTGRYEAHLWDNSCRREGQTRKGRQGGYDKEEKAARAYDLAALKYWGTTTTTNFPITDYEKEIEDMKHMTRQEYVASLRRKSSGFSRGASIYRGVTRHHQHGRWQARIGRVAGNKDLYLGTFSTQEEAAEAYDIAAIKFRGLNAVTNFEINRYDVKAILDSTTLPIGGAAKRLKDVEELTAAPDKQIIRAIAAVDDHETSQLTNAAYVIAHEGNNGNGNEQSGYENYYYYSHQGNNGTNNAIGVRGAVGTYDQGTACNNWVPTAIPALVPRPNNMAAVGGHGGGAIPTFTVWNDT
uniref:AP2/ERF domain-containing protein n=1 Tax=Chenopodium quinoa TaxID=63459 RepID=A0A803L439_CHEQI